MADELEDSVAAGAQAALGLLAARRGEPAETVPRLADAVASGHISIATRSDVYEGLAAAYVATGERLKALALMERSLAVADESADARLRKARMEASQEGPGATSSTGQSSRRRSRATSSTATSFGSRRPAAAASDASETATRHGAQAAVGPARADVPLSSRSRDRHVRRTRLPSTGVDQT